MAKFWQSILAIVLVLTAQHAHAAQKQTPRGSMGQFDFYTLSLSWSPAYCATARPSAGNNEQCNTQQPFGFIVHGLWPQYNNGSWPQYCRPNAERVQDDDVVLVKSAIPSKKLQQHEWQKHGTCVTNTAREYFTLVHQAFSRIALPDMFEVPSKPLFRTVYAMQQAFMAKNPTLNPQSLQFICERNASVLREVRVCFDKNLNSMACPKPAKTACSTTQTIRIVAPHKSLPADADSDLDTNMQ